MARIFMAMNGKKINTLDDLRTNFNGKQMLDFYRAGRLQKWLEELGENDLLETLRDFQKENYDDETLLSMLMAAFELDEKRIVEVTDAIQAETGGNDSKTENHASSPTNTPQQESSPAIVYTPLERRLLQIKEQCIEIFKDVLKEDWQFFESDLGAGFEDIGIPYDMYSEIFPKISETFKIDDVMWYNDHSPETIILSVMAQKYYEAFEIVGLGVKTPTLKKKIAEHIGIKYYEAESM